jgi:prevent-host-death family protein
MDHIIPISDLQSKAKQFVEQVKKTNQAVIITQRGRAAAVLVNYENYEGHLATQEAMSDPQWKKRLARAQRESQAGRGVELESYAKKRAGRSSKAA